MSIQRLPRARARPTDVSRRSLFQKLCYHRDALIALHRLLYLHADGAAKSKLYYRDRVLTDLVDGPLFGPPNHIVPDWPRSADVNRIRSNLNRLFDSWQGQEEGYRAMATVCRTMIEAYDRLMVRAFLGTLSGEYILAWCRICPSLPPSPLQSGTDVRPPKTLPAFAARSRSSKSWPPPSCPPSGRRSVGAWSAPSCSHEPIRPRNAIPSVRQSGLGDAMPCDRRRRVREKATDQRPVVVGLGV